jgi:hypothetical protein
MSARKVLLGALALCFAVGALLPAGALAAAAPAWTLSVTPMPANFAPSTGGEYQVIATNVGAGATTSDPALLKVILPTGLTPTGYRADNSDPGTIADPTCDIEGQEVICETAEAVHPGRRLVVKVDVAVTAPEGTLETETTISGAGGGKVSTTLPIAVQAEPLPFDFLPGFSAPLNNEDGAPAILAGSHPYQQTFAFGFPTLNPGDTLTNDGHPRDIYVELPRGMVGSLAATQVLCTEVQLTAHPFGCPDDSQIGLTDVTTLLGKVGVNVVFTTNVYNMVPPPGAVAEFATNVANTGIFVHIIAGVRSDGDYGIQAATRDVLAFGQQPIFSLQAQAWGEPSAEVHDPTRGECAEIVKSCPAIRTEAPLLTMPSDCSGEPLGFEVHADTWEEPHPPFAEHSAFYESAALDGAPAVLEDCEGLAFKPKIEARPTTNLTDSPSGLDFTLHQPQDEDLNQRAPANLKDATVTFPAGLTVNAAQAAGLGACTLAQVGFLGTQEGAPHFSKAPQSCPDAAKLGTMTVTSPALIIRNEAHEVEEDEGKPIPEPLHGSIYLAEPFQNPFSSLIAVYLVVEDAKTGIVAKLAGEGELDPQSGQITTRFKENPELPFEDVKVHLFGGNRGAFITPPTCNTYTTTTELIPWSAPEAPAAQPADSFALTRPPGGGPCPSSEAQLPNAPQLRAGTLNPTAGAYSPLLFKLSRQDGSQRLAKIEASTPTGLIAKLAGVGACSEAQIARAHAREAPEQGAAEQTDPSCPAAAEIGTVTAAVGAGPTPYYTEGHAYLAPPYKGAPLSIVTIAPAVAGPFDLGAVVLRSALYLDPTTARGRVVSDPLPTILQGVPIDLRSVAVRVDRPGFTLNPTSCAEKSFSGQAISTLGSAAPLFERFQLGGCKALPYKPKLGVRLFGPVNRGGHPRLRAVSTAKPGEANTARISFTFPRSEFIDQAHFRTICTRVQFAANQCPAGSIYGHVRAFTPLLDYPLEGPAYLRSSSHKLPDLVVALRGPAYQPLAFDIAGRVDSVNGGLRVRFEEVPDAPASKLVATAQGAKKGLFQNSTNICKGTHLATLKLDAQNGKVHDTQPQLKAQCGGKGGNGGGSKHR